MVLSGHGVWMGWLVVAKWHQIFQVLLSRSWTLNLITERQYLSFQQSRMVFNIGLHIFSIFLNTLTIFRIYPLKITNQLIWNQSSRKLKLIHECRCKIYYCILCYHWRACIPLLLVINQFYLQFDFTTWVSKFVLFSH